MDTPLFAEILKADLLPLIRDKFPASQHFLQNNDPKHRSNLIKDFLKHEGVNWWKTVGESPDLNPIENLWHELKEFIWREIPLQNLKYILHTVCKQHACKYFQLSTI